LDARGRRTAFPFSKFLNLVAQQTATNLIHGLNVVIKRPLLGVAFGILRAGSKSAFDGAEE